MPISTTIAVTSLLSLIAVCQHLYNLPETSAKAAKQAEKQARYDAKREQIFRDLEAEREAQSYSARDFGNRQYEVTPEPEQYPVKTTQPGFSVQIVTPTPTTPSYSAREIGNRLHEATEPEARPVDLDLDQESEAEDENAE